MAASNGTATWKETPTRAAADDRATGASSPASEPARHPAGPRLTPVETPRGLKLRFAYWGMRHWMGKVMTPVKVVSARVPESMAITSSFARFSKKGLTIDPGLQILLSDRVSQINGCLFCEDLARAFAARQKLGLERKLEALAGYRSSPLFGEKERAALAYVEEATRTKSVSDAVFATLQRHFTEREVVEITLLCAIENFYNLTNLPLGIGSDGFCALPGSRTA